MIESVGPRGEVEIPAGVEVVDAAGRWITPGLIDCHVHFTGETSLEMYRRYLVPSQELKLLYAMKQAFVVLTSGFTTVRDVGLGHAVTLKGAISDGLIAGPRILAANSAISSTGGHGDWTILPYEWARTMGLRGTLADGPDECRRAVRRAFRAGADLVKVMVGGGGVTNHPHDLVARAEFSPEELEAIVDETHRRGARVAAHSVGAEAAPAAVRAGVDTIEHGVFEPDSALLSAMAESGISLVPTIFIFVWVAEHGRAAGVFEAGVEAAKRLVDTQFRLVNAAHRAGVNIALGTDNNMAIDPGSAAHELALLVDAGLTTAEALVAGTRNGAIACGLADRVGTVEPGKLADLVILTRNPLTDIDSLSKEGTITNVLQSCS